MPGVFSIKPGETLQNVIARAGGLTAHAYPFGSEFSRTSAREEQQRRINDFVQDLETDIDRTGRSELTLASSPTRLEEVSTRLSYERNVAQKLRKTRASGRIVLSVQPEHTTLASAANLELEDGDRLYVPPRPAVVHVLGAVYNANTFVFTKDHTVGVHLRNAGGPTRYADQKKMFIIRADGTVLSRSDKHGLAGKSFSETVMNPGDAIVVPEHILKGSVGRTFRDWAQVTSQFALGVASVNVLRR
jgi:protein involved in polysaccharide export with SLBB domain